MFEHIILDPEQIDLLRILVEASRNVAREDRTKFLLMRTLGGDFMMHPGLGTNERKTYIGDVEALGAAGLINLGHGSSGTLNFDVTPVGFRYYEHEHEKENEPVRTAEQLPLQYIESPGFQAAYPVALTKWREAERLLWSADSAKQLTAIGHHCREAMQAFATDLVQSVKPPTFDSDPTHVVARLRALIQHRRPSLGVATTEFLDALIAYWGTLSDLVQRQEHGAQKEGQPLVWIDARRVVFQTIVVMFEIDATLSIHR
jgi:hypothetical protein